MISKREEVLAKKPLATSVEKVILLADGYGHHIAGQTGIYFYPPEMVLINKALACYKRNQYQLKMRADHDQLLQEETSNNYSQTSQGD
jgi:hypothetical protein